MSTAIPAPSGSANVPAEPTPPAQPTEGRKLEPPSGRFEVGSKQIELPKDLLAQWVLERPATQPGQVDALVWAIPAKADAEWNGPMGEVG